MMRNTRTKLQSGNSMVGMLVTVAIILVLAVVLFKGSNAFGLGAGAPTRKDGHGTTTMGAAMYSAKDDVCRSNIGQVRSAIIIYKSSSDDQNPASIEETKLGSDFYKCPVGKEPYQYDPQTGEVHCVHPGHEKY